MRRSADDYNVETGTQIDRRGRGLAAAQAARYADAIPDLRACVRAGSGDAAVANALGISLRALGHIDAAIEEFRTGLARGEDAALLTNLGIALQERGEHLEALAVMERALGLDASLHELWHARANTLTRLERIPEALASYQQALERAPDFAPAHLGIYEVGQLLGQISLALQHQAAALAISRVVTVPAQASPARRTILRLCAPGTWQTNAPTEFIIDPQTTTVHSYYLAADGRTPPLPAYDLVYNAIAEGDDVRTYLQRAEAFVRTQHAPVLNPPDRVIRMTRTWGAQTFGALPGVIAPVTQRVTRAELANASVPYPWIVRPLASHAGHGLERLDDASGIVSYLERNPEADFYVGRFVDYASADGYYRKYRVIFIAGIPYAYHLAISRKWMIHYYNAEMAEQPWMRDEEAHFLGGLAQVFDGPRMDALHAIAAAVDIDYFGIDCGIAQDGRVLVFEADAAMLVHCNDPIEVYPYKHVHIPRVIAAFDALLAAKIAGRA